MTDAKELMDQGKHNKKVKKGDWGTKEMPSQNAVLSVHKEFTLTEYKELEKGIRPREMEDKWFIYFENDQLYFHRSWTGYCRYIAKFETVEGKYCITEVIVNRNKKQYKEQDDKRDLKLLFYLIDSMLLHKPTQFPEHPADGSKDEQIMEQWSLVGRHMLDSDNQKS